MTTWIDRQSDNITRTAAPGLRWVARCGLVAEGVIYLLIGGLALVAAFEPGKRPSGSNGALAKLANAPLGLAMLSLLAVGLASFVLWQLVQTIFDPEHRRDRWHAKRVAMRLGYLLNATLYSVLVGDAAWHLFSFGDAGSNARVRAHLTAQVMQLPFARWAVSAIGVGIAVFGIFQFYLAAMRNLAICGVQTHPKMRGIIVALRVLGLLARGVVFGLIGVILVYAAWRHDTANTTGIAGALAALKRQAYGSWLLGVVSIGLIANGIFQIAMAWYRQIRVV